ncbi:unnamed protein product [Mytilus edulis]|uniref:Uncharacterized protein n=1 Tax=Mytilus edulis TaxID=6550 RepID=A0A8S3UUH2_MYTED|nr:unnamed protein product [Mytilus edulis]
MDGFALYVTNTSAIPPDGYLCYADPDPGIPNITQTTPCNQLGKYVIYYDNKGSRDGSSHSGPIVELCYIDINDNMASDGLVEQTPNGSQPACQAGTYGKGCRETCSVNCTNQTCNKITGNCIDYAIMDGREAIVHKNVLMVNLEEIVLSFVRIVSQCDPVDGICDNRTAINPCYEYGNFCDPGTLEWGV